MTEKDAEKFESVGVERLGVNRFADQKKAISGSARDHLAAGRAYLKNGKLNEAIGELSTAASLDPKLAEAHSLLAIAFDQKGLHDRAKESYEKAIRVEPEDAQALNNLGFSLYQNGNYRAAVDKLKRAAKRAKHSGVNCAASLARNACSMCAVQSASLHSLRANATKLVTSGSLFASSSRYSAGRSLVAAR